MNNPYINTKGQRERIKFILRSKHIMSNEGFKNWNYKARARLNRIIYKFEGSHKDCYKTWNDAIKYGVPTEVFSTNENMMQFLNQQFTLQEGYIYTLQGFSHKKTKTHIGFSGTWCEIKVINKEENIYEIYKDNRIKRYWFRKEKKEE